MRSLLLSSAFPVLLSPTLTAAVTLPSVLNSHMVLQRDQPVPLWGWATPGEKVSVSFAGQTKDVTADAEGTWKVSLDAMPANANPQAMVIRGSNEIRLDDILVGEVWIGSGQSNMQWSVEASDKPAEEIAAASHPGIRLFLVPLVSSPVKNRNVDASWTACSPESIPKFSAVLYYMGRHLHRELNVPVGLIASSWGGSRIEPWTPIEGFAQVPSQRDHVKTIRMNTPGYPEHEAALQTWLGNVENWAKQGRDLLKQKQPLPTMPDRPGPLAHGHQQLVGTYNAMIHPLVPFAIRGAVWYQGESNNGEGMLYLDRMKALVGGWRSVWNQGEFPFYHVQLAPYNYSRKDAATDRADTRLAEIWEAQTESARQIPHTGMAVINDIGNVNDIHPRNKQEVGRRLALLALAGDYGRSALIASGPSYASHSIDGSRIRIQFASTGSGLASRDGKPLSWFEIAGNDGKFHDAEATIDGNSVIVSCPAVPQPTTARFAFSQIAEPNLMNKEGLPAGAFRTR
jgi:sialate O-acetylesterase